MSADKLIEVDQKQQERGLSKDAEASERKDLSMEILKQALTLVTDERSAVITYPEGRVYPDTNKSDVKYDGGAQVQFVVVDSSENIAQRDQTCIAILNNRTGDAKSFGFQLARLLNDDAESDREVYIVRFIQSPKDMILQNATVCIMGLSENVTNATGRFSLKIDGQRDVHTLNNSHPRNVVSRWADGSGQLLPVSIYSGLGNPLDMTEDDYRQTLLALKRAKIDTKIIDKVVRAEEQFSWVKREDTKLELSQPHSSVGIQSTSKESN